MPEPDWWDMLSCWNTLSIESIEQQTMLIERGYLPMGRKRPEAKDIPTECLVVAQVWMECRGDVAPGPRFYCTPCAVHYLEDEKL